MAESAGDLAAKAEKASDWLKVARGEASLGDLATRADDLAKAALRLFRTGPYEEALRIAKVATGMLIVANKWEAVVDVLRAAADGARAVGDLAGEAWALHELGTLELAGGRVSIGETFLERAQDLLEQHGDHAGAHASTVNLGQARREPVGALRTHGPDTSHIFAPKWLASAGAVATASVILLVVLAGGTDARFAGFVTADDREVETAFSKGRGYTVPRDAADDGGTLEACEPLYLGTFVTFKNMGSEQPVAIEARVDGRRFFSFERKWSVSSVRRPWSGKFARTEYIYFFRREGPDDTESSGDPVPTGLWTFTVKVKGEELDQSAVTLRNVC